MGTGFKVFIELVTILFLFHVLVFLAARHVGIFMSQPEIEPAPLALEIPSLNHWTAREVPDVYFCVWLLYPTLCLKSRQVWGSAENHSLATSVPYFMV